jgi:S1-C subfamily serine protease
VVDLYDVIEEVAGSPVHSLQDFRQALDQHRDLKSLVLKISRGKLGAVQQQLVIWQR